MRVFLDDERATPPGWHRVRWPDEAITLLEQGGVTELSLDHDLGDDARGTGYDVVLWIEAAVAAAASCRPRSGCTPPTRRRARGWKPASPRSRACTAPGRATVDH